MKTYDRIFSSVGIASLAALALSFSTGAYAVAGKFQFVNGEVQVIDAAGKQRLAQKGGAIDEGETVSSTGNGFAQIKMEDGGFFAVRPDTQFKIDTFKYEGKEDGSEKGIFSLIKGSLRSVTGVVGKKHKDNYKINTATATIGIRGSGADVGHNNSIGTAVRTLFGGHSLTSGGKTIFTSPGQTALAPPGKEPGYVPNFPFNSSSGAGGPNQNGNDQPAGGTPEKQAENTGQGNAPGTEQKVIIPIKSADGGVDFTNPDSIFPAPNGSGGAAAGLERYSDPDYPEYTWTSGFAKARVVGTEIVETEVGSYTVERSATVNSSGALVGWTHKETDGDYTYIDTYSIGAAKLTVDGRDDSLGVVWGRWGAGYSVSHTTNDPEYAHYYDHLAPVGGLSFITGTHIATIEELNVLKSQNMVGTYTLVPGTFPTLVNGVASGTLTSGSAAVDFSCLYISNFQVAGSGGTFGDWSASGSGSIKSFMHNGISLSGAGISGTAAGGFVNSATQTAQGMISTIHLQNGTDNLTGAALMKGTLSAGSPPN